MTSKSFENPLLGEVKNKVDFFFFQFRNFGIHLSKKDGAENSTNERNP